MVKDVELFICFFILFIAVIVIFNARWIMKNKISKDVENKIVKYVKIGGYVVCVITLIAIYYIK